MIAAAGIPRFRPDANPRRVVRVALVAMFAGTVVLLAGIDQDASAEIVAVPLLLLGRTRPPTSARRWGPRSRARS